MACGPHYYSNHDGSRSLSLSLSLSLSFSLFVCRRLFLYLYYLMDFAPSRHRAGLAIKRIVISRE